MISSSVLRNIRTDQLKDLARRMEVSLSNIHHVTAELRATDAVLPDGEPVSTEGYRIMHQELLAEIGRRALAEDG